jgi:putative FmdB family regulatory protein
MPIYSFKCKSCDKEFTSRQSFSAPPPPCPLPKSPEPNPTPCNGETYKVLAVTSFELKGGGWFKDGY